jgi:hypothetical protein
MTQNEVIYKLSMEMALALGDLDTLQTCQIYIQMALSIGVEHYTKDMEEIIQLDHNGIELGRFKSTSDASAKLGILRPCITDVIIGRAHTAGGFIFIKTKDKELIPVNKTA